MNHNKSACSKCITSITSTICSLYGISPATYADPEILENVILGAQNEFNENCIDKCLIYAPDAIGTILYEDYKSCFEPVLKHAPLAASLCSVMPPKTPVCFASMFTGALPKVHGIQAYQKPVLKCDTIFDALVRAGKYAAIVAVENSSIDKIFRNRSIDYFSEKYDEQVTNRALEIIQDEKYDFILVYHQEYDDALHSTTPRSSLALQALRNHIRSFDILAEACKKHWRKHNSLVVFAPDHGAHIDSVTSKGTHGENIPEDMLVTHFFGYNQRKSI